MRFILSKNIFLILILFVSLKHITAQTDIVDNDSSFVSDNEIDSIIEQ